LTGRAQFRLSQLIEDAAEWTGAFHNLPIWSGCSATTIPNCPATPR
jgi:hypothetical protein